MPMQRFSRAQLRPTPWKNRGGSTREIASWPPGAGLEAFDWRVSIATIAAGGPFSVFAGVDRTIMLLEGDGVRLQAAEAGLDHRLDTPLLPFAFSGDIALDCALLGGASNDFNVMSRRARCEAEVRVLAGAQSLPAASGGLLMSLHGRWRANDQTLSVGEGLWWADDAMAWTLTPGDDDARLVAVRFRTRSQET